MHQIVVPYRPTRLVAAAPRGPAHVDRQATGRAGPSLQLHAAGRPPGARSAGSSHGLDRSGPTTRPRTSRPRSAEIPRDRGATGRVAGVLGVPEASGCLSTPPAGAQRPGGASVGRCWLRASTRQRRLPLDAHSWRPPLTSHPVNEMPLTGVSRAFRKSPDRRASDAALLISSYIRARAEAIGAKNDPHAAATAGGLVTTDWTGHGDA